YRRRILLWLRRSLDCGYFFPIDSFNQLQIESLKPLARAHVKTRRQDFIYGLIEFVTRLLAFVVFEIELALAKMVVGALDYLLNARLCLLNIVLNFAGTLRLSDCGKYETAGCEKTAYS